MKVKFFVQKLNVDMSDKKVTKAMVGLGAKVRVRYSLNILDLSDMDYEVHTLEDLLELLDKIGAPVIVDTVRDHLQVVIEN